MLRRFRRPACWMSPLAGIAIAILPSASLFGQTAGYPDAYRHRDSTSVGYVSTGYPYGWGYYAYPGPRAAPAGEFGGYLYQSPDDYVNFRGPEYVPIANADVGMPVADASGHVSLENVPMWTDERAAQIMRNREAAGLAVDSLSANRPATTREIRRPAFRPLLHTGKPVHRANPKPMQPMSAAPPHTSPSPAPPPTRVPSRPTQHDLSTPTTPSSNAAKPTPRKPLVLNAPGVSTSKDADDGVSADTSRAVAKMQPPEKPGSGATGALTSDTSTSPNAGNNRLPEAPKALTEQPIPVARDAGPGDAHIGESAVESSATATGVASSDSRRDEPRLTREDLNRATAAGIAIGRGDTAFEHGEYERARDEYTQAIAVVSDAPGIRIALGLSDYALGEFEAAAHAIRRGVAQSPDLASSDFDLLDVYGQPEDSNRHRRALDEFVTQNPEDADALFLLGFVQYFSDQREAARTTFSAYRSIVPHDELADAFVEKVLGPRNETPD